MAQFFKIRLANSFNKNALDNCIEVVDELKRFITVTDHPKHTGKKSEVVVTKPLQQVMNEILNSNLSVIKDSDLFLPVECIEETVRQVCLDPEFPSFLGKIEEIIENIEEVD